jgi:glutaminase
MGIAVWSPPLDDFGNSVKGVEFCRELVKTFNFHIFDAVNRYNDKKDPRNPQKDIHVEKAALICSAAMFNDVNEMKRLLALGVNINAKNCDYRSALHLAAAEGSKEALEFLLDHGADINIKDRWYQTPLAIAKALGYDDIVALLQARLQARQND